MLVNGYLIPANAKKGTLIFNLFRTIDLILFGTGLGVSLLLLALLQPSDTVEILMFMAPGLITGLLVFPIPNYHNVLCVIQSMIRFFITERRYYLWKGWCFYEKFSDDKK